MLALCMATLAIAQDPTLPVEPDVLLKANYPTGFQYQMLVYQNNAPLLSTDVTLRIELQDAQQKLYYSELHKVKTSPTGLVDLTIGAGTEQTGMLNDVPWMGGIYINVSMLRNGTYEALGPAYKLQTVPYALYATAVPVIRGTKYGKEAGLPIFQVQSAAGLPIFSVYEEGVSVNVPDNGNLRRPRGGFAIRSYGKDASGQLQLSNRFTAEDGQVDFYVDPALRRPRGGFAVHSNFMSLRDGKKTTTDEVLMSLDTRATFFTISQKASARSAFQLRDRCDNNRVVMNFTKEGNIQTSNNKNNVIKPLTTITPTDQLDVKWYWPVESTAGAYYGPLGFTNLIRWRRPEVKAGAKLVQDYSIEIINDPTQSEGKRLTDYLRVGIYKTRDHQGALIEKQGLMLASNVKLQPGEKLPKGKIRISTVNTTSIVSKEFDIQDWQLNRTDVLLLKASSVEASLTRFYMDPHVDAEQITPNASFYDIVNNLDLKFEITGKWKDCLKATFDKESQNLKFEIIDTEQYKKNVGTTVNTQNIDLKLVVFFNGSYQDVLFRVQVTFMV